jgi:phage shock protein C
MSGGNGIKILVRPRKGRIAAGICTGFAGYSGLDVTLVRVIVTVVSVFTGGTAALAYLAAWLIIPGEGEKTPVAPGQPRHDAERLTGTGPARSAAERKLDMDPTDPIRRMPAVSTGQVQVPTLTRT